MITKERRELLDALAHLSQQCPEMRLGQLVANLATLAHGPAVESIWDAEDTDLLEAARQQSEVFDARTVAPAAPLATASVVGPLPAKNCR